MLELCPDAFLGGCILYSIMNITPDLNYYSLDKRRPCLEMGRFEEHAKAGALSRCRTLIHIERVLSALRILLVL